MDTHDHQHKIGVRPAGSPMAQDIRGVAVGIGEDGRAVVVRSGLAGMTGHERARLVHALADLLGDMLAEGGVAGMVRVH